MRKTLIFLIVLVFAVINSAAQNPIRTRPTPKTDGQTSSGSGKTYEWRPQATETPVLMRTTLDIRADLSNNYWKVPKESNYTSWIPEVKFKVFYKGNTRLRLQAEYFLPDGKTWYSETLEQGMTDNQNQTVEIYSNRLSDKFNGKATDAIGTYGIKITDTRDNSVLFQGKFKVNKFKYGPNTPMFKNQHCFYVEQDWNIPIGYVWLDYGGGGNSNGALPTVSVWVKGENRPGDFEARFFYNGEQIATTDNRGHVRNNESRRPNVFENKELTYFQRWDFAWYGIVYVDADRNRQTFRQAKIFNDMDGECVVKIFQKGEQIREVKFNVSGGKIVDNGIAKQNNLGDHKTIIPVKVLSTTEKWNANAWKTDAFYGNPLTGFGL